MMKIQTILSAALAAVVAFSSCSKDDSQSVGSGDEAKMDLTINFPMVTRAADGNATAQDVAINSVTVFIFDKTGAHANGSPAAFVKGDFTDNGNNSYSLLENKRITTTSGTKNVYVGINLPTSLKGVSNEAEFIAEASTANLYTTGDVAMLSAPEKKNLQAQVIGGTPTVNKVSLTVQRLVSKIAATKGTAANYTVGTGATFTVAPDQFTVGNLASHFYPVQRVVSNKLVTPMKNTTDVALPQLALNANGTAANALTSTFYVPEHSTSIGNLRGEATYAVIRGSFTFSHYADVANGAITTSAATGHTGGIWVVRKADKTYFCKSQQIALNVVDALGGFAEIFEYKALYTFYYVFINKDVSADPLAVYRNQFRNVTINTVKGLGVPGDPNTPTNPPVVIPDPDEPVVETTAYLEVNIDVAAWDYYAPAVDLE